MILPVWTVTLLTSSRANANIATRPSSAETSTIQSDEKSMTILVTTENVTKSYENANLTNENENKTNETKNITNENENNTNSYETKNIRKAYESIFVTDEAPKTR